MYYRLPDGEGMEIREGRKEYGREGKGRGRERRG